MLLDEDYDDGNLPATILENVIEFNADVVDVDVNPNASLLDEDEVVFINLLDLPKEALVEVGITNEREDPLGEGALED